MAMYLCNWLYEGLEIWLYTWGSSSLLVSSIVWIAVPAIVSMNILNPILPLITRMKKKKKKYLSIPKPPSVALTNLLGFSYQLKLHIVVRQVTGDWWHMSRNTWLLFFFNLQIFLVSGILSARVEIFSVCRMLDFQ